MESLYNLCTYYIDWLYHGYTPQVGHVHETNRGNRGGRAHAIGYLQNFEQISNDAIREMHLSVVDEYSKVLFHASPDNVAFVGIYDLEARRAYLHPLQPRWLNTNETVPRQIDGNVEFVWEVMNDNIHPKGIDKHQSILHQAGVSPSHAQLAIMYGIDEGRWGRYIIGFAITKRADRIEFSAQSQTMNLFKFRYTNRIDRGAVNGSDCYITKEWSTALMTLLARELSLNPT